MIVVVDVAVDTMAMTRLLVKYPLSTWSLLLITLRLRTLGAAASECLTIKIAMCNPNAKH